MRLKFKHIIITVAFAVLFNIIGALVKILHCAFNIFGVNVGGNLILIIGALFWIIAVVLLVIKASLSKGNDFLNQ
jgi:F0F1-type ATP synthase membrane subunit a